MNNKYIDLVKDLSLDLNIISSKNKISKLIKNPLYIND